MKKKFFIIFFSICLPQIALSADLKNYCNEIINQIVDEDINKLKIKKITVDVDKNKEWTKNSLKILIGNFRWIPKRFKKRFGANVYVLYENKLSCKFRGRIRNNGNQKDHIALKDNSIIQSIDVHLENGHIHGVKKFKLLRPNTRGNYKDEILLTEILREFNYLAPRTNFIDSKINDVESKMLFQEKPDVAMLNFNSRINGPIFEGDERFMFRLVENIDDNQLSNLSMGMLPLLENGVNAMLARQINSEWNNENINNFNTAHDSLTKLNISYLLYTNSYKNKKNNFDYSSYSLNNKLLGLGNEKNILNLDVYNLIVFSANGWHGLAPNNRKFYWNSIKKYFEPINSDTNANIMLNTTVFPMPYSYHIESAFDVLEKKLININIKKLSNNISFRGIDLNEKEINHKLDKIKINLKKLKNIYKKEDQSLIKYNRNDAIKDEMWSNYFDALYRINPNIYVVKKSLKNNTYQRCKVKPFVCNVFKFDKKQLNKLIEGRLVIKGEEYQYLGVM